MKAMSEEKSFHSNRLINWASSTAWFQLEEKCGRIRVRVQVGMRSVSEKDNEDRGLCQFGW
ncbi:hypothetical protein LINPERHAP1_LOCUS4123 [Linum perenne]